MSTPTLAQIHRVFQQSGNATVLQDRAVIGGLTGLGCSDQDSRDAVNAWISTGVLRWVGGSVSFANTDLVATIASFRNHEVLLSGMLDKANSVSATSEDLTQLDAYRTAIRGALESVRAVIATMDLQLEKGAP